MSTTRYVALCLNPCFNGRYSQSSIYFGSVSEKLNDVLILVLMEDTLRDMVFESVYDRGVSLNPCFNGRYSQRATVAFNINNKLS